MLSEICHEINNWFEKLVIVGDITIENGNITNDKFLEKIQNNQYFRIVGSVFNDGIYKYTGEAITDLADEVYHGGVWLLAIPKEIITLSDDIDAWKAKYATADSVAMSPFTSESFGGYSYSKSAGGESNGGGTSWQATFKTQLDKWRKI